MALRSLGANRLAQPRSYCQSVRRLTEAGLLADTGERTPGGRGRGRVGSYYALAGTIGSALVASIAPDGVVAESVDAFGDTVASAREAIGRPARPAQVTAALLGAAAQAQGQAGNSTRLAARLPRHVPVRAAELTDQPSLAGAPSDAVRRLRSAIVAAAHPPHPA